MTEQPEDETYLLPDQLARCEALSIARVTLVDNNGSVVTKSESLPKRFGTQDLIDVAQWILDGKDPLAEYRAESERRVAESTTLSREEPWLTETEQEADRNAAEARQAHDPVT